MIFIQDLYINPSYIITIQQEEHIVCVMYSDGERPHKKFLRFTNEKAANDYVITLLAEFGGLV